MKVFVVFFLLAMCSCIARGQPTYVSPNKNHCFYCPVGTRVEEHCTEDLTVSTCADCPRHYYSDKENDKKYCYECMGSCPKLSRQVSNCTRKTNLDCECEEGRHRYPLDMHDNSWKCFPHKKCGDGEGEVYRGNHTHDTLCQECRQGQQFVNTSDPMHPVCQDCRRCGLGQFVRRACTIHTDTLCGQDGDGSVVSSPAPAAAANTTVDAAAGGGGGGDSDKRLLIALVAGVYLVLVLIGIVVAVVLKICLRPNDSLTKRKICLWLLAILLVFGTVVVIILLYKRCRSSEDDNSGQDVSLNAVDPTSNIDGNNSNGPTGAGNLLGNQQS